MSAATQVYYASFDAVFLKLPPALRARVEEKIDEIGSRLGSYPHHRLKGPNRFRARVGDYRIIYTFDLEQNKIHLLASISHLLPAFFNNTVACRSHLTGTSSCLSVPGLNFHCMKVKTAVASRF